ncbi:MAG: S8 family serine peptidase [Anaerolineae bacterium]
MKKSLVSNIITVLLVLVLLTGSWLGHSVTRLAAMQVIVEGTDVVAASDAVQKVGGRVVAVIDIIDAVVAVIPQAAQQSLAQASGVVRVTVDRQVAAASRGQMPNVEFVKTLGVDEVWAAGNLGDGVTIAFLDSGINATFADLKHPQSGNADRLLAYYDVASDQVFEPPHLNQAPGDPNGHGSHVAGIAANRSYETQDAEFRGVAPAANLVAVRVLDETGTGSYVDVLQGLNWIVQNKDVYNIRVLNISMYAVPVAPYWADPYNRAVMAAWEAGIVVVASAGNTGPDPLSIGVPGNTPYVITVGAFTDNRTPEAYGDDYMPPFSAAGPTLDAFVKPDVIAPGAHVESLMKTNSYLSREYPDRRLNGHYFEMSGTSMSTAVVSGIAALMLSENPELTPDQVKFRLMQTARPQFSEGTGEAAYSIWQQGAGRVWATDAVFTDIAGSANWGMDITADLAGLIHYQGWTTFDAETGEFKIIGGGYDSWADGYTTWSGGYDSWADGYDSWASGDTNWSNGFDSWAGGFDSWADGYDSWASGYDSWASGFDSWASSFDSWASMCVVDDSFDSWASGFDSWASGFDSWASGFDSWAAGYDSWAASFDSWAADFDSWAASFDSWAAGYDSWADVACEQWLDSFDSWAGGFDSWAGGFDSWASGMATWTGAFGIWVGGYATWPSGYDSWAGGFDSWAGGFDSWAGGFDSWADSCGITPDDFDNWAGGFDSWAGGFDSWADGYDSWASGFDSWADYIAWIDGFDSWAAGFDSWAAGFDSWASGLDLPTFQCVQWVSGFDSWASGFDSWAAGFDSWASAAPAWSSFTDWDGGYSIWAGGFDSWASGFDSWANNVGDPTWAAAFYNLDNIPTNSTTVNVNVWVGDGE